MKSPSSIRRSCLVLVVILTAGTSRAQDAPQATPGASATPDSVAVPAATPTPAPGRSKRAALENEQAMYSPFDSPWADIKTDHAFESHLFNLMRAEVRLWTLQDELAAQNSPARDEAVDIARIVHEQILDEAADALPILRKTPNKAFAQLLAHQLEAYPYEWQEEGSEQLLPALHKLTDPPPGNPPPPTQGGRRHHHRGNGNG